MNLRQLEILRAVIRHRTTVAAADELALSQPAISNALKAMEAQAGFALFERVNNRLFPTTEAMALYKESDAIFALHAKLENRVRDLRENRTGHLSIVATPPLAYSIIPPALSSFLRRRQLGARLSGPSLPLDIGYAETVPAGIRNAVLLRDRHCQWAGGCNQPAGACQVHHTKHKANGGKTAVKDCVLLCPFHHQVVIHRWGWTLVVNPDGTTTAWNKDKTKVLHSHGPPARAG